MADDDTPQPTATDRLRPDMGGFTEADLMSILTQVNAQMGAQQFTDTDALSSVWGSTLDADYPVEDRIFTQTRAQSRNERQQYIPGGATKAQVDEFTRRGQQQVESRQTMRTQDLLKEFVLKSRPGNGDPSEFVGIQQKLFMAGFYAHGAEMDDIQFGVLDDITLDAYFNLLQWTARYNEAGANITSDQLLEERAGSMLGPLREAMAKAARRGPTKTIVLSDAEGLRSGIDSVAQSVLGRKANADEQRMFIALIHGMERGEQNPDMRGQAEALLRREAPVEAGAHDVAATFDSFLNIIGGLGTT